MNVKSMDEDNKVHGESELTDEDFEFLMDSQAESREIPMTAASVNVSERAVIFNDNDDTIEQAIIDCGQNPEMLQNPVFIKCYNQVAEGPGRNWSIARRVRFAFQTMNRMGALEIGTETQHVSEVSSNRQCPDISEPPQANSNTRDPEKEDLAIFGYHHLDKHEIFDNLIIVVGVLGITILAAYPARIVDSISAGYSLHLAGSARTS